MADSFRLLMIGAMYENGGNVTHRFLDGHPQMLVYPFESQVGTRLVNDHLTSMFPVKYRWPVFPLDGTAALDYASIIDEECKIRARTPKVSKFRHMPFDFDDEDRKRRYIERVGELGRSGANNMQAFFETTFTAWKDHWRAPSADSLYVGYSPIIGVDGDRILEALPEAHVLHVVRNPWSAYADSKKRPVPLSLGNYMLCWTVNQYYAGLFSARYPGRFHVIRTEDTLADPVGTLGRLCETLGLESNARLATTTWNAQPLQEVYPWGTIRQATPEANRATAAELTPAEQDEIRQRAGAYLDILDYRHFL